MKIKIKYFNLNKKYFNRNSFVLLGGILGLFSILLYYIYPPLGSWWYLTWEIFKGQFDIYINAFGYNGDKQILESNSIYVGFLIIIGSILAIIGGIKKSMILSFISSIIMLIGIGIFFNIVLNSNELNHLAQKYDISSIKGTKVLYGYLNHHYWGLGLGFYLGLIAALLIFTISLVSIVKALYQQQKEKQINNLKLIDKLAKEDKNQIIKSKNLIK